MPVEMVTLAAKPVEQTHRIRRVAEVAALEPPSSRKSKASLTRIAVRSGQNVARGAVLFEIDSAPQQAALAVAAIDARRRASRTSNSRGSR